ncbi:MAG: VOC family protein [Limnohabitans sp.]|jgi:catechol 2,3-dioxygenase-like lactoylglutathione lyase family enzyme|nr:VOC family protein [Limnohabitans sp.]
MIGYTSVGTNDLEKAVHFYGELLSLLGAKPFFKSERGVGWGTSPDKPMFSVLKPFDGQRATVGNGAMVALSAANPEQVQALHAKALQLGAQDEGAPGLRGSGFYGAYFRDLDGNKLAAYCMVS